MSSATCSNVCIHNGFDGFSFKQFKYLVFYSVIFFYELQLFEETERDFFLSKWLMKNK